MNNTETKTIWNIGERVFDPNQTMSVLTQDISVYWSWGVQGKIKLVGLEKDGWCKGMILKVNGYKWKKYVMITLNFMDWYEVHLLDNDYNVIERIGGDICFEDLVEVIDRRIERD
jgi:hypothetical protein